MPEKLREYGMQSIGWLGLLGVWALITTTGFVDPLFLSSPSQTLDALIKGFGSGELLYGLGATLLRSLAGFLIAVLLGIPFGLLLGGVARADQMVGNLIDGLRSMPATALFPAFLLLFGIGDKAKIAVVTFVCVWGMVIFTASGAKNSGTTRRFLLRLHKVSLRQRFIDGLLLPAIPSVVGGMRATLSLALVITIGIEMIIGTRVGLGQTIYVAQVTYQIPLMYAAILVAAAAGIAMNILFRVGAKLVHWETLDR
jgi:sulfonate transport system permease protein